MAAQAKAEDPPAGEIIDRQVATLYAIFAARQKHGQHGLLADPADEEGEPAPANASGVSLQTFVWLLASSRLLSQDFDHGHALQVFAELAGPEGLLSEGGFKAALRMVAGTLDPVRRQSIAEKPARPLLGAEQRAAEQAADQAFLGLLRQVHLHGAASSERVVASSLRSPLYDAEVIQAMCAFREPLYSLFVHYATSCDPAPDHRHALPSFGGGSDAVPLSRAGRGRVTGRSLCRLCCAVGLVPGHVVAGELADLAQDLRLESAKPSPAEERYFEKELMCAGAKDSDWGAPAHGLLPGEPQYDFPEMMELLALAALRAPPEACGEDGAARARRLFSLLADKRPEGLALPPRRGLDVRRHLRERARQEEKEEGGWALDADPLAAVAAALGAELPALPPPQVPHLPGPPQQQVAGGTLPPPPPSKDELIDRVRAAGYVAPRKRSRAKAKVQARAQAQDTARARGRARSAQSARAAPPAGCAGRAPAGQVTFYAKRPAAVGEGGRAAAVAAALSEGRAAQLEQLNQQQAAASGAAAALAGPVCGSVLRLMLIDEPLCAPRPCPAGAAARGRPPLKPPPPRGRGAPAGGSCAQGRRGRYPSEQISTLVEAASTLRRLRRYSAAARLLARACALWAGAGGHLEEGGDAPPASGVARRGAPAALSPLDAEALAGPSEDSCGPGGLEVELAVLLCDESEEFGRLPPDVAVFFCCEVASLCTAVHQDALAARLLWRARRASEALPGHHPLAVAPWAGLCRVALHAGHHDAAARAALRARSIREQSLGPDTLETATAYNNLACCLHALGRPYESSVYLEIAAEVMRELAGEDHPRAQVVVRNLGRARSEKRRLVCDVPHLFALPVKAPAPPARRPSSARPGSARRAPAAAPAGRGGGRAPPPRPRSAAAGRRG